MSAKHRASSIISAPDSQHRFEQVQQRLSDLGIAYNINPRLVRGLDYYTHTAFEIQSSDLGAQATVCGGGRYDGLVAELGGPDTPAIGWGMGIERLVILLQQLHSPTAPELDFYVVSRGDRAESQALTVAQTLRHLGFAVELDLSGSAFGKQFKRADRSGALACVILGDAEAENRTVQLKWLGSGEQGATRAGKSIQQGGRSAAKTSGSPRQVILRAAGGRAFRSRVAWGYTSRKNPIQVRTGTATKTVIQTVFSSSQLPANQSDSGQQNWTRADTTRACSPKR